MVDKESICGGDDKSTKTKDTKNIGECFDEAVKNLANN